MADRATGTASPPAAGRACWRSLTRALMTERTKRMDGHAGARVRAGARTADVEEGPTA